MIAHIQKTLGLSTKEVMTKESWISLQLKMRDLPYYHYKGSQRNEKNGDGKKTIKKGNIDILKAKFPQFEDRS